jgi:hypothetical protein
MVFYFLFVIQLAVFHASHRLRRTSSDAEHAGGKQQDKNSTPAVRS